MKLLQQTSYYFLVFSLLILLIGGIGIFFGINFMFDHEMNESLRHTRGVLHKELSRMNPLPPSVEIMDEIIDIKEVNELTDIEIFKDTLRKVWEEKEEGAEMKAFRQYIYTDEINGKKYRISLQHSKFGREHLIATSIGMVLGSLVLFLILVNIFNRFVSWRLWQPFYYSIEQIRQFSFFKPEKLSSMSTSIEEFQTLDNALLQMTNKLTKDYHSLKQFAENASHEIQTPLAIIKSQIDLLLQKEQNEDNLKYIQQIQKSANKLSKLNKSLLLLTRIENRQFEAKETLQFNEIIEQKLEAMEILFEGKALKVQKEINPVTLEANPILMDVIISNLLSNSIRHNVQNGTIQVRLNDKELTVRNTGLANQKKTTELFERFRKSDDAGQSVGLGLAIVKEICFLYQWKITYKNDGVWHEITIKF